uniref:Tumor necrosis factor ligand superfamily member 14-like n=1 Tax=Acanthochromis polyacanthus TaxID=80966 RepID=A0A3Q1ERT6_9TELE
MSEAGVGTYPQVFVVDSQANYIATTKKPRWGRVGHKLLLPLVVLAVIGLIIEGFLIHQLYQKTEALSLSRSHPPCQNLSNPQTSGQMVSVGAHYSNDIPPVMTQTQQRPFAHLMGPSSPAGENSVVQWTKEDEAITHNMKYEKGHLIIEKKGYYYLYSKVQLNAAEECELIQHRVMKNTSAYDHPIELMKSKSFHCWTPKITTAKASGKDDLWNNFLAGIFHLESGDKIFVTLDKIKKLRLGLTENFMGAFLIFP